MCGIAGFSGKFEPSLLNEMNAILAHRGPDADGVCYLAQQQIGLGHRRLSIIDLSSHAEQPMWSASKRTVISYNGEIYNYQLLRNELRREGVVFKTNSDTEVVLALYEKYGVHCVDKLNGIYAFAIADVNEGTLFLARDPLGVKPLYYAQSSQGVIFASELKAILLAPSVSRELNPQAIQNYVRYLWSPGEDTMLRAVKKCPPGSAMLLQNGEIKKQWTFYQLPYDTHSQAMSAEEAVAGLEKTVTEAVERQLTADVPVGAFLSGGLDSSALVALARNMTGKKLDCFTLHKGNDPKNEFVDDLPYARRVAKHLDVNLHEVQVRQSVIEDLPAMIYYLDEPQADIAAMNVYRIAKLANSLNYKVLLSGAGGDDLFTGYRRHLALQFEKVWAWWPKPLRQGVRGLTQRFQGHHPVLRRAAKLFQYAGLSKQQRLSSYFNWLDPATQHQLYSPAFNANSTIDPLLASLSQVAWPKGRHALDKMLYLETKHFLADHNLNYTDKLSMAAHVETRVPYLDLEMMRYATTVPMSFKLHGNTLKWILKKTAEKWLPKSVIYRPKAGFGVPLRHWMEGELKQQMQQLFQSTTFKERQIFNTPALMQLMQQHERGRVDAAYPLLAVMSIEMWCRIFIDGAKPSLQRFSV